MSNLNHIEKGWKPDPQQTLKIHSYKELLFLKAQWSFQYLMGDRTPEIRSSSLMKPPLHQHYPYLRSVIFSSLKVFALVFLALFYVASESSKIFYARSLFCHNRFMFFPLHQAYYTLFFHLLKNTTRNWANIFSALSCPSRAFHSLHTIPQHTPTSISNCSILPLWVLWDPLYLLTKGNQQLHG